MARMTFKRYQLRCRFLHTWEIVGRFNPEDGSITVCTVRPDDPDLARKMQEAACCPVCLKQRRMEGPIDHQELITYELEDL